MKSLPFWNALPEYKEINSEIYTAIKRVLSSGTLILGPEVASFERSFARFIGCRYGIGVGNGTDAITIGLRSLDVGEGDEVIAPANTAIPTVAAILATGATPKLVDVLPATLLMDPKKLEATITKHTRCIIPVHLYGQVCDMRAILNIAQKHNVFVLEDCAQSTGAASHHLPLSPSSHLPLRPRKAGSMGDIATFSFYPTKIIGAYGDGGMITTNNAALAKRVRMLRMYGTRGRYIAEIEGGTNSRLDELHAAILSVKLKYIEIWIKQRQRLARRYDEGLNHTPLILPSPSLPLSPFPSHVSHLYVVRHKKRDAIRRHLEQQGINTAVHYPVPIHLMPAYINLGYKKGDFPVAEKACQTVLSLPLYPGLTNEDQDRIIRVLQKYFS